MCRTENALPGPGLCGLALGVALVANACAWVPVAPEAETVRPASYGDVSGCERIGKTHVKTQPRIWLFARNDDTVGGELVALARNEAARMGGNRVAAESGVEDGRQTFGVYRCP